MAGKWLLLRRRLRVRAGLLLLMSTIVCTAGIVGIATFASSSFSANAATAPFSNEGISPRDGAATSANFDGGGYSYSGAALQSVGFAPGANVTVNGVSFQWPTVTAGIPDNWLASGQALPVTLGSGSTLGFLGAVSGGVASGSSGTATLTYSDGSTQSVTLTFSDWTLNAGKSGLLPGESVAAVTSYRDSASGGRQTVKTYVFYTAVTTTAGKTLIRVTLPSSVSHGQLHIFAVQGVALPGNNEAISPRDGAATSANFDGGIYSYSNSLLRADGFGSGSRVTVNGISFQWPNVIAGVPDNWQAAGQILSAAVAGSGGTLAFLGAASGGDASGTATLTYSDGTTQTFILAFSDWTLGAGKEHLLPGESVAAATKYRDTKSGGTQTVTTYVFYTAVALMAGKTLARVTLPTSAAPGALHIFSVQAVAASNSTPTPTPSPTPPSNSPNWTTYLGNNARTGFNGAETALNATTFPNLHLKWKTQASTANGVTGITVQPVEANGIIYWGSWDGTFHATNLSGQDIWTAQVGQTQDPSCTPSTVGVASTATIGSIGATPAIFVAGGNNTLYAFNATTGATLWSTSLAANNHPSTGDFIWGSAALYNGSIYIGMASFGDCPLVQGQLIQLSASTGQIQNTFNVVPNGCTGGGITGSPTIDTATGILYIATGNPNNICRNTEPYTAAMVALHASDLSFISAWQIPGAFDHDYDFVNTPTLFSATINGAARQLVGTANKNGVYYTFDRANISAGPVWQQQISISGDCPQCGGGSISPSAWDGATLYVAGGATTINGVNCLGSVNALDPNTGNFKWRQCTASGPVLGALTAVTGVVIDTEGATVEARNASTGVVIFSYTDTTSGALFYGAASVADDRLYVGGLDGILFSFGL